MKARIRLALGIALLGASAPAWVHHSGAMFDSNKEQTLNGTITEFNWVNPHSSFKVNVKGADGSDVIWAIEMNAPQNLVRQGWKRTTLKSGDKVSVVVHPLRDGKPGGSFVAVTLADGTKLGGSGPGQSETYPAQPAAAQ
jgi:Family of unknown function (DUF6152)